ncbi:uncharacterized protein LTHEOB_15 [Neofusicoccum parvum]|uniref:Uncharacterized protein LTHEOB_15 n=1 Tax=Neofusicoccum parvum TaxID=310453 RepID=A0ACB5RTW3_9PEZI|nr:uncharacterized protein LTHEOB_15 [Neofusicoccum parvum]
MARSLLRKSCDRCHLAKLKCVYEAPLAESCIRCQSRGRECTRSPPKPFGRTPGSGKNQRRKQKQEQESAVILSHAATSTTTTTDDSSMADAAWLALGSWPPDNESPPSTTTPPTNAAATTLEPDWLDAALFSSSPTVPDYFSPWAELGGSPPDGSGFGSPERAGGCPCGHAAHESLLGLARRSPPGVAFDDTLEGARRATAALRAALECAGAHAESTTVLLFFVAQSVLAALRDVLHAPGGGGGAAAAGGSPQIRLGSYAIACDDEEDGRAVRRLAVLLALRRLLPVLDQLADKHGDRGSGLERLYPLLRDSLRADHEVVLRHVSC